MSAEAAVWKHDALAAASYLNRWGVAARALVVPEPRKSLRGRVPTLCCSDGAGWQGSGARTAPPLEAVGKEPN